MLSNFLMTENRCGHSGHEPLVKRDRRVKLELTRWELAEGKVKATDDHGGGQPRQFRILRLFIGEVQGRLNVHVKHPQIALRLRVRQNYECRRIVLIALRDRANAPTSVSNESLTFN